MKIGLSWKRVHYSLSYNIYDVVWTVQNMSLSVSVDSAHLLSRNSCSATSENERGLKLFFKNITQSFFKTAYNAAH